MSQLRDPRSGLVLLGAALVLTACGGESPQAQPEIPSDSLIRPMEREPLGEADLVGITLAELALELPWTQNKVSRDAAAGAPAAGIQAAEVAGHDGFDRVTFTTADPLPATGYEIVFAEAGATVACGSESHTLEARSLVVRFAPATAGSAEERWIEVGVSDAGEARMARAGVVCDAADTVVWVAELAQGDQVRVLELREPGRIAVDVR